MAATAAATTLGPPPDPTEGAAALVALGERDNSLIQAAVEQSVADCMAELGFEYQGFSLKELRSDEVAPPVAGAGKPVTDSTTEYPDVRVDSVTQAELDAQDNSPAYGRAMSGDGEEVTVEADGMIISAPRSGCQAEGEAAVFGSIETALQYETLVSFPTFKADALVHTDKALLAAQELWSVCMSEHGYQFGEFGEASAAARADRSKETELLGADKDCTQRSNLDDEYRQAVERANTQLVEEKGAQILAVNEIGASAEARARSILNVGG